MPFPMESGMLLVKGVPAEICGDCGEPYLVGHTVDRIKEILKSFEKLATEVSIVSYRAA
jgi:hypothetical protein